MTNFRIRLGFAVICVGLFLLGGGTDSQAADSGLYIDIKESEAADARVLERWKLYGSSHALVIGIDDYVGGWPKLRNAVRDARELADELERHGFQVTLKTDSDATELREILRAFYALRGADPEARLLLWFAGHGHTINGEGFLVPADAPLPNDPLFKLKALHLRDFGGLMRLANSKHVLSVFDSCFSGTIFTARAGASISNITHKTKQPVRQFITSGDAGQQVRDDGSFRKLFVRALRGEELADANADGYVTGEELGLYLSQRMTNLTQAAQTPRHGRLQDVNYDQGDFVFALPKRQAAPATDQAPKAQTERQPKGPSEATLDLAFWDAIKDSDDPQDYQDYLDAYPYGRFVSLARRRARVRSAPQVEPEPPAQQQLAALTPAREPAPELEIDEMDALYRVTTRANVRSGPSTKFEKIETLAAGKSVNLTGKVMGENWYRIALAGGREGFIFGKLIQDEASYTAAQAKAKLQAAEKRAAEKRAAKQASDDQTQLAYATEGKVQIMNTSGQRLQPQIKEFVTDTVKSAMGRHWDKSERVMIRIGGLTSQQQTDHSAQIGAALAGAFLGRQIRVKPQTFHVYNANVTVTATDSSGKSSNESASIERFDYSPAANLQILVQTLLDSALNAANRLTVKLRGGMPDPSARHTVMGKRVEKSSTPSSRRKNPAQ